MKPERLTGSPRNFRISFLEMLTRTSIGITVIYYPMLAAGFVLLGYDNVKQPTPVAAFVVIGGFAFWTLFEYLMHRFVFHIGDHWPSTAGFQHALHGFHHNQARDKNGVLMPPFPGFIITSAIFGVNLSIMGWSATYFTSGMLLGYVFYAWIHYNIHMKPPPPMFRSLWRHHTLHHCKYPDKAFGVSTPFWDIVFRTMPPKKRKVIERENVYLN